jgi:hypothetical protein
MHFLPGRFAERHPGERSDDFDRRDSFGCNSIHVNKIRTQVGERAGNPRRRSFLGPLFALIDRHQASPTGPTGHGRGGYRVGRHLNSRSHGAHHRAIRFFRGRLRIVSHGKMIEADNLLSHSR